ncbi:hypothetical protein LINGRAHAP2_LOCUS31133 [Linum grandiflorum]
MWEDVKTFNLTKMKNITSFILTSIASNTFRAYQSRVALVITLESLSELVIGTHGTTDP